MMFVKTLLAVSAACLVVVSAVPAPHHGCHPQSTVTVTVMATSVSKSLTSSSTSLTSSSSSSASSSVSSSSSSTSAASFSQPTAPFTAISARSGSPVHLLALTAIDYNFYLGGVPATYCPNVTGLVCPPEVDSTVFVGLSALDVIVPGGQQVYVAPDGHLGYTEPHSALVPPGSVIGYTYIKQNGSAFGDMGTSTFGATGFMACFNNATGSYQVFASLANATVPSGNVADCLGFDALTSDYLGPIAWEYV